MKVTKRGRQQAKQLLGSCRIDGVLDERRVREAVAQVIARKPRGYYGILSYFRRLLELDLARRRAKVQSATALGSELQAGVQTQLTRRYGPGLEMEFAANPALVGGMRIQVGSDVFDGSVRARLAALEERF